MVSAQKAIRATLLAVIVVGGLADIVGALYAYAQHVELSSRIAVLATSAGPG